MHTDYNTMGKKKLSHEKLQTKCFENREGQLIPISSLLETEVSFSGGDNV